MSPQTEVLFFTEDPGAANYIAGLPIALQKLGREAIILAAGSSVGYLKDRDIPCMSLTGKEDVADILAKWSPKLVAVGTSENPRTLGLHLVDAAHIKGLPTVGLVDGFANAAFRFRGMGMKPFSHAPDFIFIPDDPTAKAYQELGMESSRLRICGHPHWDEVRRIAKQFSTLDQASLRARLFPGCKPDRLIFVFAAEISVGLDSEQYQRSAAYTLEGKKQSQSRTEIVLDEFLEAVALLEPKPFLILRLHPKNLREEFDGYLGAFDLVSSGGSPFELLQASDVVVGMTSMILQEAVIMGKVTLAILPRESEKTWLPTIAAGITPSAVRKHEVRDWMRRIANGYRPNPKVSGLFGNPDANSADISASYLDELLKDNHSG